MKKTEDTAVNAMPEDVVAIPRPANELDGGGEAFAHWPKEKASKDKSDKAGK